MKERYIVQQVYGYGSYNSNLVSTNLAQNLGNKQFDTYQLAVEYIEAMFKYHNAEFQIQKVYTKE